MATLKKFDLSGEEVGEVVIEDSLLQKSANSQMVKDYLIAILANARQWSASTKSRAEVAHSGQKPHPQKGTGRARQGYLGAPQYKGGGRVGGPRPKFDQHVKVNRKEKRAALRFLLAEKIKAGRVIVLQPEELKQPKSQKIAAFLKSRELEKKRVLFLSENASDKMFIKSMRNIPKIEFVAMPQASGYDVVVPYSIVVLESAVEKLVKLFEG